MNIIGKVNATLFQVVAKFIAKDLLKKGIAIQLSEAGGVNIIATDGQSLIVAHDPNGEVIKDGIIISATAETLKLCHAKAGDRTLVVCDDHKAIIKDQDTIIDSQNDCLINGYYPDWQRAFPNCFLQKNNRVCSGISIPQSVLKNLTKVVSELYKNKTDNSLQFVRLQNDTVIIRFKNRNDIVALFRTNDFCSEPLPDFLQKEFYFAEAAE